MQKKYRKILWLTAIILFMGFISPIKTYAAGSMYDSSYVKPFVNPEKPMLGHSYTSEETISSTCTTKGEITFTCENCNDTYIEEIEMLPHEIECVITPAGMFTTGLDQTICKHCGVIINETIIPQTFPLPLYICCIILGIAVLLIISILILIVKKHAKKIIKNE